MREWLNILIGLSVTGSGILIFTLFIMRVFRGGIAAKWHYLNRKLSLLFFLIPIFIIPGLIPLFEKRKQSITFSNIQVLHQKEIFLTDIFIQVIFIVWIIGVIVTSLWFLHSHQHFNKKVDKSFIVIPDESIIQHLLHKHIKVMQLPDNISIIFCRTSMSPVLIGIFNPTIVLPFYDIPNDELDMIIKHELTHLKKKDLWIKRAMLLAIILHWYNPFIYFLQKEINKWSELSCDEDVVMEMSHSQRKKYGETILNMMQRSYQDSNPSLFGVFFAKGSKNLKNRLIKILEVKKGSKLIFVQSVSVSLILVCLGITGSVLAYERTSIVSGNTDQKNNVLTILEPSNIVVPKEMKGGYELDTVKKSDESIFSKEDWAEILKQVENGEVILEDGERTVKK